nr:MAG: hypothetical protein [Bacteriophage sp.]
MKVRHYLADTDAYGKTVVVTNDEVPVFRDGRIIAVLTKEQSDNIKTKLLLSDQLKWSGDLKVFTNRIAITPGQGEVQSLMAVGIPELDKRDFILRMTIRVSQITEDDTVIAKATLEVFRGFNKA